MSEVDEAAKSQTPAAQPDPQDASNQAYPALGDPFAAGVPEASPSGPDVEENASPARVESIGLEGTEPEKDMRPLHQKHCFSVTCCGKKRSFSQCEFSQMVLGAILLVLVIVGVAGVVAASDDAHFADGHTHDGVGSHTHGVVPQARLKAAHADDGHSHDQDDGHTHESTKSTVQSGGHDNSDGHHSETKADAVHDNSDGHHDTVPTKNQVPTHDEQSQWTKPMTKIPADKPTGACYGALDHILHHDPLILPYAPAVQEEHELNDHHHLDLVTASLFVNKNPQNCPIKHCVLREDDCRTALPGHMAEMMDWPPFEISAFTDVAAGWHRDVCAVCWNQDQHMGMVFVIDQRPKGFKR